MIAPTRRRKTRSGAVGGEGHREPCPRLPRYRQQALDEFPEKVDHEQHAALLLKLGVDPGGLAEKAAERGIASL